MQELIYEVEFKSDIVLPATSNTEGNIENLDFIGGSNFLGMVAREYSNFEDSFSVFHSGKVRFGDATILKDGNQTYKMPLSYFHEKGKEETFYNHHFLTKEDFKKFEQLKQKRNGYITENKEVVYIDYNYSQKSAYDKKKRTSLEGSMFGYSAMRKGLKWQFSIKVDDGVLDADIERIKKTILKSNRLGKSKSAQYGLVKISEYLGSETSASPMGGAKAPLPNSTILYFKSRVALVDESGNPTYDLKYLCDGLKDEDIEYDKCQIKTSTFTPYNGAMQTKTYERIVINKGSVIVLNAISDKQLDEIQKGIGVYLADGFGEILINPSFLNEKEFGFNGGGETSVSPISGAEAPPPKTSLAKFLKQREDKQKDKLDILNDVDKFITDNRSLYKNIKPSQWGKIRSICISGESNFKEEIEVYISNGTKKWEQRQIDILLGKCNNLEFVKLLSIQIPKGKSDEN